MSLSGYDVGSKLWESTDYVAYGGVHKSSGEEFLIKTTTDVSRGQSESEDPIWRECAVLRAFPTDRFLPCRKCIVHEDRYWGVFPWYGGKPLSDLLRTGRLSIDDSLTIIGSVAPLLDYLHASHCVHGDLSLESILWCKESRRVHLSDLGLVSGPPLPPLTRTTPPRMPKLLYASPERIYLAEDAIDYRTDFYSLGVILYRLLLGRPPFVSDDPSTVARDHKAHRPPAPMPEDPSITGDLWSILQVCLEKDPASRYSSGAGLAFDLAECGHQLRENGKRERFELRTRDVPTQLVLSDSLYGRSSELERLEEEYRKATRGGKRFVLVHGNAGIGKTSLVNQLHTIVDSQGGTFVSGKYEQYQADRPYAGLTEAMRALTAPILSSKAEDLDAWRDQIDRALGENAAVIGSVLPELGFSPPVELPPRESRNRFLTTFVAFLGHFISDTQPLVLFLDDLQWMDSASEELLTELLSAPDIGHLLVVGAYRTDEVTDGSGLASLLGRKSTHGAVEFHLGPLGDEDVERFLTDTLYRPGDRVQRLADCVKEKTNNNPFFMARFLEKLYGDGQIRYDPETQSWTWDDQQIANVAIADNVVGLVIEKLKGYPPEVVDVLSYMACLGGNVPISRLSLLMGASEDDIYRWIQIPAADGVLIRDLRQGSLAGDAGGPSLEERRGFAGG